MVNTQRFEGAKLIQANFPDDDGTQSPALAAALTAFAAGQPGAYVDVVRALQPSRLLVPVVALLGEVEYDENGLAHDKSSDMATVLIQNAAGEKALLAFTSTATLQAWNAEARPVPAPAHVAASSALQEEAAALLIDIAGPVPFPLTGADLQGVAAGWELVKVGEEWAWAAPAEGVEAASAADS
ncbi:SseB family protein [Nocardioides jejuensis]|uniref:SseB family protein n=1 Tax=Nocardioides jejuensis TaxID=2502782 RepID=A0A4R1BTV2_9ACTN|nr:SseB family protein [Nocardioides jejuensis]TCJ21300.1 SseB family protein [Nocardioides jejuensis]